MMLATLVQTTRPAFLLLALSVTALAVALAFSAGASMTWWLVALVALGAVIAHACVNVLNEVDDARSGLDALTERTPFSGGSGALQAQPRALNAAAALGLGLLALVIAIGLYFIYLRGWGLFPLGLLGVVLVVAYTPMLTRLPWLCLIAPGLGFGPLMVLGSYYVLTGSYSGVAFATSFIPFFLVNNLLLLNQFPDAKADVQVGRRHLIIATSPAVALRVFQAFLVAPYVLLVALVGVGVLPLWALLGLVSLVVAIPLYRGVSTLQSPSNIPHALLGQNVVVNLSMPALIAVGLLLA
ncbi:prenyltransferase [Pseudidiomarina sediminum]|uniref:Prenyltransferase n=1 Tax=Pseudidiomarina sediminum TaxID=431675 RepID=A0A432Z319_9GAMM|nr:prenyltransferase [Pseudidiomarina sediminum]RUO72267.1 prenyltransferase [Pseudidiomarina sediminum]